jgi:serine/threonine protein kinase
MGPEIAIEGYADIVEVGRGGFGRVFRAKQLAFGRDVAIKVLSGLDSATAYSRFERECLAAGSLSGHPNIVTVYGNGRTSDGSPFLAMDFMEGGSLLGDPVAQRKVGYEPRRRRPMSLRQRVSSAPSKMESTRASTKSRLMGYSSA